MLTHDEVVAHLREQALIDPEGTATPAVVDVSRRNRNVEVSTAPGVGFFVKQGVGPERAATVAHEADTYHRLARVAEPNGLDRYLLRYLGYDPIRHVLVLGLVPGSQSLHEYHATRGRFSVTLARALGDALAYVHAVGESEVESDKHTQVGMAPWVLSLHRPDLAMYERLSGATIELVKMLQQIPDLCDQLDSLRLEWKASALIHNDVRWDNCLVFAAPNTNRVTRLKLIDWELSQAGDPLWDVACAFSEYLAFWLTSIPITGDAPPDRFLHLSRHPIERMQPAIRSLWHSYLLRARTDPDESARLLRQAVRYAGAKLVQSAFERTQNSAWITSDAICLLQLSLSILQEPSEAATMLLGISVDDGDDSE